MQPSPITPVRPRLAQHVDQDYGSYAAHPLDPRTPEPDDELRTEREIEEDLRDQYEQDAYRLAWWLNNDAGIDTPGACSLHDIKGRHASDLTNGQLLVRLLNSGDPAAIELLSRFRTHFASEVAREAQCHYDAQF